MLHKMDIRHFVLLFLIFMSDLPLALKHTQPSIFADDTNIITSANSIPALLEWLEEDIESLRHSDDFEFTLNTLKT